VKKGLTVSNNLEAAMLEVLRKEGYDVKYVNIIDDNVTVVLNDGNVRKVVIRDGAVPNTGLQMIDDLFEPVKDKSIILRAPFRDVPKGPTEAQLHTQFEECCDIIRRAKRPIKWTAIVHQLQTREYNGLQRYFNEHYRGRHKFHKGIKYYI
jgi:hypothetical protein